MAKKKTKKESPIDIIARNVAAIRRDMATKEDLKAFATKKDLFEFRTEMNERFKEVATKEDLYDLERKLIEDTSVITGVEQKHHDSLTQRVMKLEKVVFPSKTP